MMASETPLSVLENVNNAFQAAPGSASRHYQETAARAEGLNTAVEAGLAPGRPNYSLNAGRPHENWSLQKKWLLLSCAALLRAEHLLPPAAQSETEGQVSSHSGLDLFL